MGGLCQTKSGKLQIFFPFPNSEQPYIASAEFKVWMRQLHRKSSPDSQKYFVQNCVSEGYSWVWKEETNDASAKLSILYKPLAKCRRVTGTR